MSRPEVVALELFTGRFTAVAREMGERLRRTALSVNVKERLDFSCGVLDRDGRLVVNAPHIPVHLGALGECVRRVREAIDLGEGDVVVTNHPAHGGSHLPDVTLVSPVFAGGSHLGYVATRAHHAEIGGSRPGSMPPDATCLADEGVVIPPTRLVRDRDPDWEGMRRLLTEAPHPTRALEDNLADLEAMLAANSHGVGALTALVDEHGLDEVDRFMGAITERAAERMREAISELEPGKRQARERLDDGTPLSVHVEVDDETMRLDFTGTGDVHPGNLNATRAVVRSVTLYVLRLIAGRNLPLNEGLLEPVELVIPSGLLDPPFPDDPRMAPAVVGGNVETSQRLVDTLIKAFALAACSQGTMNNVLFGNDEFGYYETVCGGAGAVPGCEGESAVHTHMTNTRITDPEVLEHRYPVRLERFAVRRGSGGAGRFRGGDGVERRYLFLEPVSLSLLSQHRGEGPFGEEGGEPGAPGRQRLVRRGGDVEEISGIGGWDLAAGDRLVLETPGGGGWGAP